MSLLAAVLLIALLAATVFVLLVQTSRLREEKERAHELETVLRDLLDELDVEDDDDLRVRLHVIEGGKAGPR